MSGTEVACAGADADATGCFGGSSAARVASLGADVVGDAGGNAGAGVTVIGDVGGGEAVEGTAGANDLNQDPTAPPERVQEADEGGHPVLGVSGRGRSQSAKGTTPTASAVGEAKPDDVENDAGETAWESLEERIRAGGCNGEEIHCGADPLTAAAGEGSEDVDRLGAQKDRMTGYPTSVTAALGMSSNLQRRLHRFKQVRPSEATCFPALHAAFSSVGPRIPVDSLLGSKPS